MSFMPMNAQGNPMLQSTLSSASAGGANAEVVVPHHPITCTGPLNLDLDIRGFSCEHVMVNMDTDTRTKACCIHSLVLLVLEPAVTVGSDWKYKTPDELIEEWNKAHPEEPWN